MLAVSHGDVVEVVLADAQDVPEHEEGEEEVMHLMAGCRMCRCTVMIFLFFTKSSYQLALLSLNGFFTFSFSFFSSSGLRTSMFTVPTRRLACIGEVNIFTMIIRTCEYFHNYYRER